MKKTLSSFIAAFIGLFLAVTLVSAHVVVKPSQVGIGAFQTFVTGVPNEKDNPTIAVRLVIPDGLKFVSPNVKPGWKIDLKKTADNVTEINWSGGQIPAGFRDEFNFSAQAPASETTLKWKAYQTYQNGQVVSWDQEPTSNPEDESVTPYSTTKVVNDLAKPPTPNDSSSVKGSFSGNQLATILASISLLVSVSAFFAVKFSKK